MQFYSFMLFIDLFHHKYFFFSPVISLKMFFSLSLAFFYQIKENPSNGEEIENIVKHFDDLNELNDSVTLPYTFPLQALIGNINTDRFYTYRGKINTPHTRSDFINVIILGSLTTPKCNEAVTWIIFPDTIPISLHQMAKFRSLSNGIEGLLLVDNYRHLQPIGNRKIFVRSIESRPIELERLVQEAESESEESYDSEWYYN